MPARPSCQDGWTPFSAPINKHLFPAGHLAPERTAQYGDRVAIENHTTGRRLTYHEVCAHATALAGALQRRGLQKGDVVEGAAPSRPAGVRQTRVRQI